MPPVVPADTSGATVYDVSAANSELDILVLRGGALSKLGHNHVISSRTLSGRAYALSKEEQIAKLRLVVETAQEVWG